MFPIKCKDLLPLDHLIIKSVAVRGRLGPITVWVSKEDVPVGPNGEHRFKLRPKYWQKIYEKTHSASFRNYKQLVLDTPIRLVPGQVRAIYVSMALLVKDTPTLPLRLVDSAKTPLNPFS
jgi:hypothetical protein